MNIEEAKHVITRFFKTHHTYDSAEMSLWLVREFMGWLCEDDLIEAAYEFERRLESYIENYDPTPWEAPVK